MKSKILSSRKGQINKKIEVVVIIIISIVVLFQIFAGIVPEAQSAGDTMNSSNRCEAVGCFFNTTTAEESGFEGDCGNNASSARIGCSDPLGDGIPLSALFSSSGILILLLMVALFLGALRIVLPKSKK